MDGETPIHGERHADIALGGAFDWHNDDTRINMNMNYQKQQVFGGRSAIIVSSLATDMPVPTPTSPSKKLGSALGLYRPLLSVRHDGHRARLWETYDRFTESSARRVATKWGIMPLRP
jgi:hypothetical protein